MIALLSVLVLDAALALSGMRLIPDGSAIFSSLARFFERRLNRSRRSEASLVLRGAVAALFIAGIGAGLGLAFAVIAGQWEYGLAIDFLLLVHMISLRGTLGGARTVSRALVSGGFEAGRDALLARTVRNIHVTDDHGVARATVEIAAHRLCSSVVAPVFWYLLLGLPGLLAYRAVSATDAVFSRHNGSGRGFGGLARSLDDLLGFVPARLTAVLIALAALFVPGASMRRVFKVIRNDAARHPSRNTGWLVGAVSGAFNLALCGPQEGSSGGRPQDIWIGDGRARVDVRDIRLTNLLLFVAWMLQAAVVAGLLVQRL